MRPLARRISLALLVAFTVSAAPACARPPQDPAPAPATPAAVAFRAAGRSAPITIYPVLLAGAPSPQVAEALGLLLERSGMTTLELSDAAFTPPPGADADQSAAGFADFIRAAPPPTDYAVSCEFLVSPDRKFTEVRTAIATRQGEIVWQDRQRAGDRDFDRLKPAEPLTCCMLVAQRLRPVLNLNDPQRADAPEGRLTQRWQKSTGLPDKAEAEAMNDRAAALRKAARTSTLTVYPTRIGAQSSPESAAHLTALIKDKRLFGEAAAAPAGPAIPTTATMNEQKVLWSAAREFSAWLRVNPPATDYALMADYLMGPKAVGAVHVIICDRRGEIVAVDFQNSHHADFKSANPRTAQDCDQFALTRITSLSR